MATYQANKRALFSPLVQVRGWFREFEAELCPWVIGLHSFQPNNSLKWSPSHVCSTWKELAIFVHWHLKYWIKVGLKVRLVLTPVFYKHLRASQFILQADEKAWQQCPRKKRTGIVLLSPFLGGLAITRHKIKLNGRGNSGNGGAGGWSSTFAKVSKSALLTTCEWQKLWNLL